MHLHRRRKKLEGLFLRLVPFELVYGSFFFVILDGGMELSEMKLIYFQRSFSCHYNLGFNEANLFV